MRLDHTKFFLTWFKNIPEVYCEVELAEYEWEKGDKAALR